MRYRVMLQQSLSDRAPRAMQARYRLRDGRVQAWPVTVHPEGGSAVLEVESGEDMLLPGAVARSLVGHYATAPLQEERQISSVSALFGVEDVDPVTKERKEVPMSSG
ncbi:hypothetical protein [Longimicrobium sp.]|uniref:hypothetical protein n=1 Tax=Longimicrobium sp. TaxID=2029185 RepID=UPI002E32902D|nr:hypothetical protein [Longimicrobium sp.]HEX6038478.1 hypothetical protein [Longimicrobium sp.]